jgi:hypothetical protein
MVKFVVNNPAGLVLPGAQSPSAHGSEVEADPANAAVAGWIDQGLLVMRATDGAAKKK